MFRKSKWVSLLCAMMIGVLLFLAVTAILLISGVLSLNKTNLTFTTESVEALYDGVPLTNHNWRMSSGKLKKGHELEVTSDSSQTNVGECKNMLNVRIVDELGADVTSDYSIHYNFGTLKVKPRTLVITSESATKVYDGQPLTAESYEILAECDGLVSGHKESVLVTGYIIEPGRTSNTISAVSIYDGFGNDVTVNYKIVLREGLLVVDDDPNDNPDDDDIMDDDSSGTDSGDDFGPGGGVEPPDQDSTQEDSSEEDISEEITSDPDISEEEPTEQETTEPDSSDPGSTEEEPSEEDTTEPESSEQETTEEETTEEPDPDGGVDFDGSSNLVPNDDDKNKVLYIVYSTASDTVYLKMQSYGDYDGSDWYEANAYEAFLLQQYAASYLTSFALMQGGAQAHTMEIKSLCGIYALPYYLDPHAGDYAMPGNDLMFTGDTSDVYTAGYYKYSQNALVKHSGLISEYEQNYRSFVYSQYLKIDPESDAYMQGLIEQLGFSKDNPQIIAKVASYIQNAAVYDLKYDPGLDREENIAIAFLEEYKQGVCRHYASAATLMYRALGIPARYTVGIVAQTKAGTWTNVTADKAHAWVEVYVDGIGWTMVEVTGSSSSGGGTPGGEGVQPTIELTPVIVRHQYDGTEFDIAKQGTVALRGFEDYAELGYTYEAVVSGKRTEPGKAQSVIEDIRVFDADHNDVTDQFRFKLNKGVIHVYLERFDFVSASCEKVYDGRRPGLSVTYDRSLDERFDVHIVSTAGYTVGKHTNTFKVTLTDANGEDVTDHYWINNSYGQARITPLEITVKAGDAQKIYDGTPVTCDLYTVEEGALVEGHRIGLCRIVGSQTEIGRSDNIITHILIQDANGKDVTSNYSIRLFAGKLKVTRN